MEKTKTMLKTLKAVKNAIQLHFNRPLVILVEKTNKCAEMPRKMHDNDAGFDVEAISQKYLKEFDCWEYGTGLKLFIPHGYYIEFKPRSSIFQTGLIATSSGVIDEGYHDEVKFHFYEFSKTCKLHPYSGLNRDRIGQFILHPYTNNVVFKLVDKLPMDEHDRKGGFGSTNINK